MLIAVIIHVLVDESKKIKLVLSGVSDEWVIYALRKLLSAYQQFLPMCICFLPPPRRQA